MKEDFVFFYDAGSPFSNWYMGDFEHGGIKYNCSEQFMMREKALLFKDTEVAELIMEQKHPRQQKFLGREVRGFVQPEWLAVCEDIMVPGLVSKFTQNAYCLKILLGTEDKILVEAAPLDKIWGIGLSADNPLAWDQSTWQGQNLLGKVLMRTRDAIRG